MRQLGAGLLLTSVLVAVTSTPIAVAGPSFDCSKAAAADERAICNSDKLSELDVLISKGFAATKSSLGADMANKVHRPYMRLRHACGDDALCILQGGLAELDQFRTLETIDSLPEWAKINSHLTYDTMKATFKVGDCAVSKVKEASARLCSEDSTGYCVPSPDTGSSLILDNDMYGVSYDKEAAVDSAKTGDLVTACLVSIPDHCPSGDDRGYVWSYTFKRTKKSVELPDAEHMCGGA